MALHIHRAQRRHRAVVAIVVHQIGRHSHRTGFQRIVEQCSDTDEVPKPPWLERKQRYIDHLGEVGQDTLLVSVADKLDNARSMLRDYHEHGPALWDRFNRKNPQDHLWYYDSLLAAYREHGLDSWMVEELGRVVGELKRLVEGGDRAVVV